MVDNKSQKENYQWEYLEDGQGLCLFCITVEIKGTNDTKKI